MKEKYTHPVELLIHSTTRIMSETSTGLISTGTGYYFNFAADGGNSIPCIVTNKHVVHGAVKGKFCLNKKNSDGSIDLGGHISLEFSNFESRWVKHPDANIDLAVFPIGPILHQAGRQNIVVHYTPLGERNIADANLLNTLPTMEDIIMIGYPNGIWDEKHNLPIIRRGITATHPKLPYNGKPEFLIDAACFPGSSGSPVFLANIGSFVNEHGSLCTGTRVFLLGTLYAGPQHTATGEVKVVEVPTRTKPVSIATIPNNLGLVIHAGKLDDFNEILKEMSNEK